MPDTTIATGRMTTPSDGLGVCGATGMQMQAVSAPKPSPQPQASGAAATQSAASSNVQGQK
jgi:hypothetical protein